MFVVNSPGSLAHQGVHLVVAWLEAVFHHSDAN